MAVTADRRRAELAALLEHHGARVLQTPALSIVPARDDDAVRQATRALLSEPPDLVVVTTGPGFRSWVEAADLWGLGDQLRRVCADVDVWARGPESREAVRAAGLLATWAPPEESPGDLVARLRGEELAGRRVAVQLHGVPWPDVGLVARDGGADVLEIRLGRWVPVADPRSLRGLVEQVVAAEVDCLTFTSAPAVAAVLALATQMRRDEPLRQALSGPVLAACIGPVTAAPLHDLGIPTAQPASPGLADLARTVCDELAARRTRSVVAGGHRLVLRESDVLVDGSAVALTDQQVRVLAALMSGEGRVLSRAELLRLVWPDAVVDEHAVEMTVARLRTALGDAGHVVQTVVKRGYRLNTPL